MALAAFTTIAAVVSTIADIARDRALEADLRRREADLAASLARELLAGAQTEVALRAAARRVAEALEIPSAALELGTAPSPTIATTRSRCTTRAGGGSRRCSSRSGFPPERWSGCAIRSCPRSRR